MCLFLADDSLRDKFMRFCCAGKACASKFKHFARHHLDWRWEFLSPAVAAVMLLWTDLCDNFDLGVMLMSETGKLSRKVLDEVNECIKLRFLFPALAEMFNMFAQIINLFSSKLEGCHCHSSIWTSKRKHSTKLNELERLSGWRHCIWKGRQGAWWIVHGIDALLTEIKDCKSDKFETFLNLLPEDHKVMLLGYVSEMASKLIEVIKQKMQFWRHIPWKVIGVFWSVLSDDPADVSWRAILKECIDEFDQAVAAGRVLSLHRVARRLLSPSTPCGRELRELHENEDKRLADYPFAYWAVLCYALIPLVERNVEAIHAMLKRLGRAMTHVDVPYACAVLREPVHVGLLESSKAFHTFCIDNYRKRLLFDTVLKNRYSDLELKGMGSREKLRNIYQCTLTSQFESMDAARDEHKVFKDAVDSRKLPLPLAYSKPPTQIKQTVQLIKGVLQVGHYYSLPEQLFESLAQAVPETVDFGDQQPADIVLDRVYGSVPEFDFAAHKEGTARCVFFRVVNTRPEARNTMDIPHVSDIRFRIVVMKCRSLPAMSSPADWHLEDIFGDQVVCFLIVTGPRTPVLFKV